ncbi:cytosolic Fe-S cluster assembly factor NBP35, putative [Babesia caballi]|uniref:Cytosolic Fe-S cluster assembly factor NBP35, putative n=1 Tax=Babesia caballi TaxID=5871 RepID=A0AAV4LY04_BABCB|nr:cytosolic Fe-S cluster assembly factor NBP35, putative [Babesia caballi]
MQSSKGCLVKQAALAVAFMVGYHFVYQRFVKRSRKKDDGVPEDCPGVQSPEAGTKETCEGCPNQTKCASGEMKEGQHRAMSSVAENLAEVGTVVLVMSGKGGVGKSTVATQLAYMLSAGGSQVGLLDIDLTGPSVPGMTGTENAEVFESASGWTPVYVTPRLAVLSIGHMLRDCRQSIIWRGPRKDSLIKQFLIGVDWGRLDYLVVDCPPGSSDEHITICNLLQPKQPKAVLVTTPQRRCVDDVYRSAAFCSTASIRIAALVENMTDSLFDSEQRANTEELCERFNIKNVLRLSMQQEVVAAGEEGRPLASFDCLRPLEAFIAE